MTRVGLTQRVDVVEEYGERRDCLDQEWTVLLEDLGYEPLPLPNRIENERSYLDALSLDAVVLTSGNDLMTVDDPATPAPERDQFEKAALEYAIDEELPVLGVCRGLELLNEHFGGQLSPITDHVACTHRIRFNTPDESNHKAHLDIPFPDETEVNSYHDYAIDTGALADDLVALGVADDETIECVVHETLPICGIMWHPERESPSAELDRQILNYVLSGEIQ